MISSRTSSSRGTEIATPLEKNYFDIQQAIDSAAVSVGRDPADVLLVAVSKMVGISEIQNAIDAGIHDFGENRTHLLREKQQTFPNENWHYIGNIQTNKLKDVVGKACLIHSVASERALKAIDRLAQKLGIRQSILLEVNVSGEATKEGASPAELPKILEAAGNNPSVQVRGLMTMAPLMHTTEKADTRRVFTALRELRDKMVPIFAGAKNISLNELSMGMSDDFTEAIQEGATMVRIGRRLWS